MTRLLSGCAIVQWFFSEHHQQNKYIKSFERNCIPKSFERIAIDAKSFEKTAIFRKISVYSKYFRIYCEILRNNAKYIAQYCENRPNKTMQTLSNYFISGSQEVIFCILSHKSAVFHNISQYFAYFQKFLKFSHY